MSLSRPLSHHSTHFASNNVQNAIASLPGVTGAKTPDLVPEAKQTKLDRILANLQKCVLTITHKTAILKLKFKAFSFVLNFKT